MTRLHPFAATCFTGATRTASVYLKYIEKAYWWGDFHHVADMWLMPNDYNNNTILSFSQFYTPGLKDDLSKDKQKELLKTAAAQGADRAKASASPYKEKGEKYNRDLGSKFVDGLYEKYDPADVK